MGALVFVTTELSPFTPGGIGRVVHNMLAAMSAADRARSIVLLLDARVEPAAFEALFPGARLIRVDSEADAGRFDGAGRHPPRRAYGDAIWHWRSAVVFRVLRDLARETALDYVEFPDWAGLGFVATQEKRICGVFAATRLAVRLHSTHAVLMDNESFAVAPADLILADIERKTLRDCDLIVGQLAPVAEATRRLLGFAEAEWTPRLKIHAPPVRLDARAPATRSLTPGPSTPILFGSKLQQFKRPDLFMRGVGVFCHRRPDYSGRIVVSAHSFDADYRDAILSLIPPALAARFSLDAPREAAAREPLIAASVFVAPSDFESFCLSAYEAGLLGAVVVVNAANPAFGEGTPWRDGENCITFDGSAFGLAQALERAFALRAPLALVEPPDDPWPWNPWHWTAAAPPPTRAADAATPRVSVIATHRNLARHVPATLANLLEQTYANCEIILVDDGSTDAESRALIAALGKIHRDHLKILEAPVALGPGGARNFGLAAASGAYILPIDAGDLLDRRFIAVAVAALERHPDFDVFVTPAGHFVEEAEIPLPGEERDFAAYRLFLGEALISGMQSNAFAAATALFRAAALRRARYDEGVRAHEDWGLALRLAQAGARFLVATDVYFHRRDRPGANGDAGGDPATRVQRVHDMMRGSLDIGKAAPLAYLAFLSAPPSLPAPAAETAPGDAWPFALPRRDFKRLMINAARRQIRAYRLKHLLLFPIAGLRRRYRERLRLWRGVLRELQDWREG